MEKRRSQLTKRSFSNDPYDTGNGISTIQRVGSFELSPLSEELFSSNSDSVDLFEANGFPMASLSNKKVKKSIRSYFTRKVCLVLFLVILIVIYFGYAFDLKSYFLTAFHLTPDSQSNDYLRNRGIKHGSVLETYGKSESIKMKLKDKDKLGAREKLLLDGNNFANESPSDDLLVQLLAEQKEKISAKVRKIDDSTKPKPEEIINQVTKAQVDVFAERLRYMKQHDHTIMEQNATAIQSIREFQNVVRKYLVQTYGNDPYFLEMELTFPDSMLNEKETSKSGKIVIQLAPIDLVPYSVYYFLQTVENFKVLIITFYIYFLLTRNWVECRVGHFIEGLAMYYKLWYNHFGPDWRFRNITPIFLT